MSATVSPMNGIFEFRFSRVNLETGYVYDCDCGRIKGSFDGRVLDLSYERFQVSEIEIARACDNAQAVIVPCNRNRPAVGIAANKEVIQKLIKNVNAAVSKLRADRKVSQVLAEGEENFRTEVCPYCSSTVELTNFEVSPQVFCTYCFSLFQPRHPNPTAAAGMGFCKNCGLFDKLKWYRYTADIQTTMFGGTRYVVETSLLCQTCLKNKARGMCILAAIGVITMPIGIWLYRRTVKPQEMPPNLEKLKDANKLVASEKPDKIQQGQEIYQEILAKTRNNAGIRTNVAQAHLSKNDLRGAVVALEAALEDCSNFAPAANLLMSCYGKIGGKEEEMNEVKTKFGWDE